MRALADFLDPEFTVIGHRGAAGLVAENTLPSFRRALELGCPMLELDVHRVLDASRRSRLIVLHDEDLARTTSGSGDVATHSLTQIRTFDAGDGEKIPLLDEVAQLIAQHDAVTGATTLLNVELKGPKTAIPTAKFAERHPELAILVSSFNHAELLAYRKRRPDDWVAPLYGRYDANWRQTAEALNACAVNLNWRLATPARIRAMRDAGFHVFVYTVNQLRTARRLAKMRVSGVFTDRPDRLLTNGQWRG